MDSGIAIAGGAPFITRLAVVYVSEGFRALNPEAEDVLEDDEAPEGEVKEKK